MSDQPRNSEKSFRTDGLKASNRAAVHAAGENIRKFKRKQVEYFLKVAKEAAGLKYGITEIKVDEITSWLRDEMCFSEGEAKDIAACSPDVLTNGPMLEASDVSLDTLLAILRSHPNTQSECFIRIARGDRLDKDAVEVIQRSKMLENLSPEQIEEQRKSEVFNKAAAELGPATVSRLQFEALNLLQFIDQTVATIEGIDQVGFSERDLDPRLLEIGEQAATLLRTFELLFGTDHLPRKQGGAIVSRGTGRASISYSWYALRDLATSILSVEHLRSPATDNWKGWRKCLEFLAGRRFSAISHANAVAYRPALDVAKKPTFVDIDAGVGGTALGLQAAGFRAVAVWVKDATARRTMRQNRPSWRPRKFVGDDFEAELRQLADEINVDLVTCGLPWHHYHYRTEAPEAVKKALAAVKILNPKAFLFEAASEDFDEDLVRPFKDIGYDVLWHTVDVSRFGIAQLKCRSVIVGARDGYLDSLSMPVVDPPVQKNLSETIGDLVAHEWGAAEGDDVRLEHWTRLEEWNTVCSNTFPLAPELPCRYQRRRTREWRKLGIDVKDFTDRSPTLNDFNSSKGFRLTSTMLARIQGFPDIWIVDSRKSNAHQIAASFPPPAAKMLGLAIHAALIGTKFDYRRAAQKSLLYPKKVSYMRSEPLEYLTREISSLLIDPNLAFRKSAAKQRVAQKWDRYRKSRSAPASVVTGPPASPENAGTD